MSHDTNHKKQSRIIPLAIAGFFLCMSLMFAFTSLRDSQKSTLAIGTSTIINAPPAQVHQAICQTTDLEYWLPWCIDAIQPKQINIREHLINELADPDQIDNTQSNIEIAGQKVIRIDSAWIHEAYFQNTFAKDVLESFVQPPYSVMKLRFDHSSHKDIVWLRCLVFLEPVDEKTTRIHIAAHGKRLNWARVEANFIDQPAAYRQKMNDGLARFKNHVESSVISTVSEK